jgi:tRNA A-37 threonylcarbamoyl transferase component Bud32
LSDDREFLDGEVVPGTRYTVRRLIGTGGMGRVYEVEHRELGKRFVLKSLQRELARREDLVARLRNEWRALARLEHPNIVSVTDAGTSDSGVPFYVMERLEGETLGALLYRQRRLHPEQALGIAAGILEGLHAAHQIGVVHRDVKPPNVFLTASSVKILDFGIAKIRDAKDVITARGIAVGTPRYMSPEQAQGTSVDARSDIYATGLMLFEMLSGVGPFDDVKDHNELLLAHLGRKAPLLSSICVVAPELDAVVAGMLAKDPRERPASARDVAETLRSLSQRYGRFVGEHAPTLNAPRPVASFEPTTRLDTARPLSPVAVTRPEAPLALERAARGGDTTTLQPAIEVATTLSQALPGAGGTQRLPHAVLAAGATFHGPDTLVDGPTQAPTAVPAPAAERTEILRLAPPAPGQPPELDPGPTRTLLPAIEAPNLTPPPVVPAALLPAKATARRGGWLLSIAVLGCVAIASGVAWGFRGRPAPLAAPSAAAVTPPEPPAPVTTAHEETPAPAPPPAAAATADAPPPAAPVAEPARAAAVPRPSKVAASAPNIRKSKGIFLTPSPPSASGAGGSKPKPESSMPGSGL